MTEKPTNRPEVADPHTAGHGTAIVYAKASLAVLIPAALVVVTGTRLHRRLLEGAVAAGSGMELVLAGLLAAIALELHCLGALCGLIRFRGRAVQWQAWRNQPSVAAPRRRRRLRAAAAGVAVLFGLLVCEIGIRAFGLYDPAAQAAWVDYAPFLNEPRNRLGIREDWDAVAPADTRLRIAVLGDSIVYGLGVSRDQTFTHLLEAELQADHPQGVLTINLGGPGTAPHQQLRTYQSLRDELRPDLVVHVLYPNDLGVELRPLARRIRDIRTEPFWTGRFSHVLHLLELRLREFIIWRRTLAYYHGGLTAPEREKAWSRLETAVAACRDAVHESGAAYAIVMFPWLIELDDYPLTDVHDRIQALARRLEVPYLDLLDGFKGRAAADYRIHHSDEHPGPAGHRLAAREIAEFLRREILVDGLVEADSDR